MLFYICQDDGGFKREREGEREDAHFESIVQSFKRNINDAKVNFLCVTYEQQHLVCWCPQSSTFHIKKEAPAQASTTTTQPTILLRTTKTHMHVSQKHKNFVLNSGGVYVWVRYKRISRKSCSARDSGGRMETAPAQHLLLCMKTTTT